MQLKKDKVALNDKVADLTWRRDKLETYLGGLAKKMFLMLEGIILYLTDCKETFHLCRCQLNTLPIVQNSVRNSRKKLGGLRQVWTLSIPQSRTKLQ